MIHLSFARIDVKNLAWTRKYRFQVVYSQILLVDYHHSSSNSEWTVHRYSAFDALSTSNHLMKKPEGINYPKNPCSGYVSKWLDDFNDCLACDSTTHRFDSCLKKNNVNEKNILTRTLGAYSLNQEKEERPYSSCTYSY